MLLLEQKSEQKLAAFRKRSDYSVYAHHFCGGYPLAEFLLSLFVFLTPLGQLTNKWRKMTIAATILALALALPTIGSAETVQIEFTKFDTFSIEVVHINVGDTVEWLPKNAVHNVEFIAGPQMHTLPKSSKMDEFHSVVFKTTGVYLYGCTPHLNMGMLGLVVVGNDLHNSKKLSDIKLSRIAKSVLEDLIKIAKSRSE